MTNQYNINEAFDLLGLNSAQNVSRSEITMAYDLKIEQAEDEDEIRELRDAHRLLIKILFI